MILQSFIYYLLRRLTISYEFEKNSFPICNRLYAHLVPGMSAQLLIIVLADDIFIAYGKICFVAVNLSA